MDLKFLYKEMVIQKNAIWRINSGLYCIDYIKQILSRKHFLTSELIWTFWKLNQFSEAAIISRIWSVLG